MPRSCTVCNHAQRAAIDAALVNNEPYRHIASQFGTSTAALQRHKADHLPAHLARAQEAQDVAQADDLLGKVRGLEADARRIQGKAEKGGDYRTALMGIRELVRIVELSAELAGELNRQAQVNIILNPQWVQMRGLILAALSPYPDARRAVAEALRGLGA